MSRLAKKPIVIPEKVTAVVNGHTVLVKGPIGEISREFRPEVSIVLENGAISVTAKTSSILLKTLLGTTVAHIKNMLKGAAVPFQKKLIVEGIGFKSEVKGKELVMSLGFSHQVKMAIPEEIKVTAEKNLITVLGINKEAVGQFAAVIRDKKKPEPYKGKGIRYDYEVIRRKEGKKTV